jgi:hypothetical protein
MAAPRHHRMPVEAASRRACRWFKSHTGPLIAGIALASYIVIVMTQQPPVTIKNTKVTPEHGPAGSNFVVSADIKVLRECPGKLYRMLVSDAAGHPTLVYDPVLVTLPPDHGKTQSLVRDFHVPMGFSQGRATFRWWDEFDCTMLGWTTHIAVHGQDAQFTIDPPKR